jgi:ADP-ribose pyrophosphatase YjhB (NUDIX family)
MYAEHDISPTNALSRSELKYCSECGAQVALKWVPQESRVRCVCDNCRAVHYQNPRVVVACVVMWEEKILLCRRSIEPARGQWMIPSGFLECGETLEEGAARETFEESGVVVDPGQLELSSIMNLVEIDQIRITFRTSLAVRPELIPSSESDEIAFMSEEEIPNDELAWRHSMGNGPQQFFAELRAGTFTIRLISAPTRVGEVFKSRPYWIQAKDK